MATSLPLLIGAYATMPAPQAEQEQLYARIFERSLGSGLEIPDAAVRGVTPEQLRWLAQQIQGRFFDSAVTAIPTTMGMQAKLPGFGLASSFEDGRVAALDFIAQVRRGAEEINQLTGEQSVSVIHVHSAPTITADAQSFRASLEELTSESATGSGWSTRLVVEHCDAYSARVPGEKRFLGLSAELVAARENGLGLTLNWGRSVLESHDGATPLEQIQEIIGEGSLEGVMFSGAGADASQFGGAWADAHLPLAEDEPASWMTAERVRECVQAARDHAKYFGVKIQTPAERSVDERLDYVEHISVIVREG